MNTEPLISAYDYHKSIHRRTFNKLAPIYAERFGALAEKELFLLGPLSMYLKAKFSHASIRVLDIGCGAGGTCSLLHKDGFETHGIDLSPRMIDEARKLSPETVLIEGDFLEARFETAFYQGICVKAVLHLLDSKSADFLLRKAVDLLCSGGALYVSVASGPNSNGEIKPKLDYPGQPMRFKKTWTQKKLLLKLNEVGVMPVYWALHKDFQRKKIWIDCWARKV
jgi:SAM-dependent methyltransferase